MSDKTKIEWSDSTFNPWIGCTQISPACDHCYAAVSTPARTLGVQWGAGQPRRRTSPATWKQPLRWNRQDFRECGDCGWRGVVDTLVDDTCPACGKHERLDQARRRVFCASLSDWLDNEVPVEWLVDLLDLIRRTPNLDWLLLTKRIGNWKTRIAAALEYARDHASDRSVMLNLGVWLSDWVAGKPPANIWIGATTCNQAEADRDVPKLLRVPAAVRFLSIEPMLGPIDFYHTSAGIPADGHPWRNAPILHGIHWIIAGGESGRHARPMHPDWARSLRDQCDAAGVAFNFKQWGNWANQEAAGLDLNRCYDESKIGGWVEFDGRWSAGDNAAPQSTSAAHVFGLDKKFAGRLLDGALHNAFPRAAA